MFKELSAKQDSKWSQPPFTSTTDPNRVVILLIRRICSVSFWLSSFNFNCRIKKTVCCKFGSGVVEHKATYFLKRWHLGGMWFHLTAITCTLNDLLWPLVRVSQSIICAVQSGNSKADYKHLKKHTKKELHQWIFGLADISSLYSICYCVCVTSQI